MIAQGNTVNIERRYHHGQLRAQLVTAGMALLERGPAEEVSLRAVARESGVSPTAVYRHFADKAALLRAIAAEGFARLAAAQAKAGEGRTGRAAFAESGIAYVNFALEHPAVFRLMFASPPAEDLFGLPEAALDPAMRLLLRQVASVEPDEAAQRAAAVRAWSLVHGLAVLALSGMVHVDSALVREVVAGRGEVRRGVSEDRRPGTPKGVVQVGERGGAAEGA